MHLANMPHVNDCRTGQEAIARAQAAIAWRRQFYSKPKPVFLAPPKPATIEKNQNDEPLEPAPLPPLLNMVVWPNWALEVRDDRFSIRNIQCAVARQCLIELKTLIGRDRTKPTVKARHVAMAICRVLTTKSYPEMGRRFGGKDHSTVIHAVHKMWPVIKKIKPIAYTADLADIVTLALEAYDQLPARKPGSGRPIKKSTVNLVPTAFP